MITKIVACLASPDWIYLLKSIPASGGPNDFIISSDVFENVCLLCAIDNVFGLLKPGGLFILTAPFRIQSKRSSISPNSTTFKSWRDRETISSRMLLVNVRSKDLIVLSFTADRNDVRNASFRRMRSGQAPCGGGLSGDRDLSKPILPLWNPVPTALVADFGKKT